MLKLTEETQESAKVSLPQNNALETSTKESSAESQSLLAQIKAIKRKRQRNRVATLVAFLFMQVIYFGYMFYGYQLSTSNHIQERNPAFDFLSWIFIIFTISFLPVMFWLQRLPALNLKQVLERQDTCMVGPLIDAVYEPRNPLHAKYIQSLYQALIALLPRLKASDADLLTDKQKKTLYRFLKDGAFYRIPDELNITILQALEQVGDSRVLPIVEELARRKARTSSQRRLQEAAIHCLPALKQHLDSSGQTLLRASQVETPPDTLLRPAFGPANTEPDNLLRATDQK